MQSSHALPYAPLQCDPVLPLTQLPVPDGFQGTWDEFAKSLPHGRMNIMQSDGYHIYLGHSRESVAIYRISRSRGVKIVPVYSAPIVPPVTINNMRVADFSNDKGGSLLLMTGGREDGVDYASISVLEIPTPNLVATLDDDQLSTFWSKNKSRACTITIPECSAWGLDVHNPTSRFALSANSCTILVLSFHSPNLRALMSGRVVNHSDGERFPEETLSIVADPISDTHSNNIPTVKFSPCGKLLASGSIDESFALHDVKPCQYASGEQLFQSPKEPSTGLTWSEWVWCVHWVGKGAVCDIWPSDDVWLESDMQAIKQGSEVKDGLWYRAPPGKSIFADGAACTVDERDGVAPYDDCIEPEPSLDAAAVRQWYENQFRDHHLCYSTPEGLHSTEVDDEGWTCANVRQGDSFSDTCRTKDHMIPNTDSNVCRIDVDRRQEFVKSRSDTVVYEKKGFAECDSMTDESSLADEQQERFLVVGRELSLYLYRVTGNRPGKTSQPFVEELHHLQVCKRPLGYRNSAFLDCLELTDLSAFAVVARGHGVFLVRLLREAKDEEEGQLRLYIERTFPQRIGPDQTEPWQRDETSIIGVCAIPRGEKGSATQCYELWILWKDGMIEAWELSRGDLAVDVSTVV